MTIGTRIYTLTLAASICMGGQAVANDTMAVLGAGGLVFTRSDDISMVEEDLYISPTQVKVDYTFRNASANSVSTIVAFPMPRIGGGVDFMGSVPDMEQDNFMDFTVTQDGAAIEPKLQQRALVHGIDFTDEVKKQGVPLMPLADATRVAIGKLDPAVLKDWQVKGLIVDMNYTPDGSTEPEFYPTWELDTVYWWETVFPAGRDVKVEHNYKPSLGGTTAMVFIQDGEPTDNFEDYKQRYCLDDDFMAVAAKLEKSQDADKGIYYFENWLSYILTTGGNWFGSIEKFRLTVDKGSEKNIVSFCGEGVKKTGPTTFEMTATDFYPQKDLDILLVVPSQQ
ncbi:DUF4424 domain-containing protein [Rhizobium sp. G187]|uniref:DUF4424 domain-containing protein n=1 Tax=unclassified Rhizobium TaxID=2613769 RepID=UPI0006B8AF8A|nr:DUF4424 domain-containing protein [Rhizobium sp. AAP43]KPF46750.1 hypothetical protein IP76_02350 [Rhizobium sp. AAP43]